MSLVGLCPDNLVEIFSKVVLCLVERDAQVWRIVVPVACVNRLFAAVFRKLAQQRSSEMRLFVAQDVAAIRGAFLEEYMRDVLAHSNDEPNVRAELHMGGCAITAEERRTFYGIIDVHVATRRLAAPQDQHLRRETMWFAIPIPLLLPTYVANIFERQHASARRICLTACDNNTRHVLFS